MMPRNFRRNLLPRPFSYLSFSSSFFSFSFSFSLSLFFWYLKDPLSQYAFRLVHSYMHGKNICLWAGNGIHREKRYRVPAMWENSMGFNYSRILMYHWYRFNYYRVRNGMIFHFFFFSFFKSSSFRIRGSLCVYHPGCVIFGRSRGPEPNRR